MCVGQFNVRNSSALPGLDDRVGVKPKGAPKTKRKSQSKSHFD